MHVFLWISVSYLPYTCCISLLVFGISGTRITLHFTWIPSHQLSVMPVSECPKFRGKSTGQLGGGGAPTFFLTGRCGGGRLGLRQVFLKRGKNTFLEYLLIISENFQTLHFIPFSKENTILRNKIGWENILDREITVFSVYMLINLGHSFIPVFE